MTSCSVYKRIGHIFLIRPFICPVLSVSNNLKWYGRTGALLIVCYIFSIFLCIVFKHAELDICRHHPLSVLNCKMSRDPAL